MSNSEGKGSIILKILIIILIVGLILTIIIPGKIWDEEEYELTTERTNLVSIYEAEKFYYQLTKKYTTDPQELLNTIHADSSLQIQNSVVYFTRELKREINSFLSIPIVNCVRTIDLNMTNINLDLESNSRNFRNHEDILKEAEDLHVKINELRTASKYTNFIFSALYIDSLKQLGRNITEYTLQVGATMSLYYADTISNALDNISLSELAEEWRPYSERLGQLMTKIARSDISTVTSVADRVRDFRKSVDSAFVNFNNLNMSQEIDKCRQAVNTLEQLSTKFLENYLITSKLALVKMSEADSLVLNLTEQRFFSPINGQPIKIIINEDSSEIKVESPVLLDELKERALPVAENLKQLNFLSAFKAYIDTLNSIKEKSLKIRRQLTKNTDLFIKYKEIEELINKHYPGIQLYSSFNDLYSFTETVPTSESYSEITNQLESSLNAVRIINQSLQQKVFGNLDTLHRDLTKALKEFNNILASVRRLPTGIVNFDEDINEINSLLESIKSSGNESQYKLMEDMNLLIGEHLEFAKTGVEETMYILFNKTIINPGYVALDVKSWEEEK